MLTTTTAAKAERLHANGNVVPAVGHADVFFVRGDTSVYLVVLHPAGTVCTCPATGGCSHILAAQIEQEARA
jgi:hypothetical protein